MRLSPRTAYNPSKRPSLVVTYESSTEAFNQSIQSIQSINKLLQGKKRPLMEKAPHLGP